MPRSREWVSLTWAAGQIGLSVRQLQEYAKRPKAPRRQDAKGNWLYQWPDFNWFVREESKADAATASAPADLDEAKARKMSAEAELAEMERDVRRGELVEVARFEAALLGAFGRVREKLLALPSRLAPSVVGLQREADAERAIERGVAEVIDELRSDDVPDLVEQEA